MTNTTKTIHRCTNCGSASYITVNAGALPDHLAGEDERLLKWFRPKKHICAMCGGDVISYEEPLDTEA